MLSCSISQHASIRANQRGVPQSVIAALLDHADVEVPVGRSCSALRLSKRQLQDGELRAQLGTIVDRLEGLTIVCANGTGEIVTILHDHGRAGRRYRH